MGACLMDSITNFNTKLKKEKMEEQALKNFLQNQYDRQDWQGVLQSLFSQGKLKLRENPIPMPCQDKLKDFKQLGSVTLKQDERLDLFEVEVSEELNLARNRVGVSQMVKDTDHALCVYHQAGSKHWRLSLISKSYGFHQGTVQVTDLDAKRYTFLLGQDAKVRTPANQLFTFSQSGRTLAELEKAFSVDPLNKEFYQAIQQWYDWACQCVQFPNDLNETAHQPKALIRLLTRLIFCWFLKEKNLINQDIFDRSKVAGFLNLNSDASSYYKAMLQNLFFGTLNKPRDGESEDPRLKREFRTDRQHYNITHLYRYKALFQNDQKAQQFIDDYFKDIPFLNGGLFECLDQPSKTEKTAKGNDKILRVDGFSDRPDNPLKVPNHLFFENTPLAHTSTSGKLGLFDILNRYQFTLDESTASDVNVALDPELLGQIFENLLGAYNPETKDNARKSTGSFYTPREVVQFMVDESLQTYFAQKVQNTLQNPKDKFWQETQAEYKEFSCKEDILKEVKSLWEDCCSLHAQPDSSKAGEVPRQAVGFCSDYKSLSTFHKLFRPNSLANHHKLCQRLFKKLLIQAIDDLKILDPACGSGAFPMGILNTLVQILHILDPKNDHWKQRQIQKAEQIDEDQTKTKAIEDIETLFQTNQLGYSRKLYLIQNCIYGTDLQNIAVQISKLRFFISLLVDQDIDEVLLNYK